MKASFYLHNMKGEERKAAAQTIEWPYGFGEKFSGSVASAADQIIRNSDLQFDAFVFVEQQNFSTFTTLELFEETEIESYHEQRNIVNVRTDRRFIGRIYCDKLPLD